MDSESFRRRGSRPVIRYVRGVASQFVASAEDVTFTLEESDDVHSTNAPHRVRTGIILNGQSNPGKGAE